MQTQDTPTAHHHTARYLLFACLALCTVSALQTAAQPTAGLVAHYRFENDANDQKGLHHGTVHGDAHFVPGVVGQAIAFDGNGDYVEVANYAADFNFTDSLTLSVWIKPNSPQAQYAVILDKSHANPNYHSWVLQQARDDTGRFNLGYGSAWGWSIPGDAAGSPTLPHSTWSHLAVTKSGTTIKYYLNGVFFGEATGTDPVIATNGDHPLFIGRFWSSIEPRYFSGMLDEVRIYNRALTDAEIGELATDLDRGLVGNYPLDVNGTNLVPNSAPGLLTNINFGAGYFGQGAHFDGTTSAIDLGNQVGTNPTAFTIACWVNIPDQQPQPNYYTQIPIATDRHSEGGFWATLALESSDGRAIMGADGSFYSNMAKGTTKVTGTGWHFLCGVKRESAYEIYVDGTLEGTVTDNNPLKGDGQLCLMYSGAWGNPKGVYGRGVLDNVRIYNRALAAAEVQELYAQGGVTATNLAITAGPATVAEHSTNGYACTAGFSDGTSHDVSAEAQWSISPVLPGFRINAGQLEAGNVSADTLVRVSAEYGGKSDVREVLVVAAKAELVEYYLASAQAPLTMNVGMVGAALFPPTSCEDATSEVAGNQITYTLKTPGSVLQDIQPSPYTWGAGERALQRQVSFLNVPVYVFDPVQGYCDCSITGRDGEGVVIDRKRAMVSKIQGRFRVKPALNDVTLEAQAYGYLDSYTLAGIMADIDLVNTGFQAIRQGLKYGVRKAIEKGLEGYVPGKVVDVLVDPVSEYEGQLTMTLVGGGAGVEREVLYVFPLTENYLGVSREVGEESVSSAPFEVGDGELVQWELDLESYVRTHGYGRAAATFDTFEVRILHKGEVIGTVNSGYRPRALTASAVAKTERPQYGPTPEAAAMGSGIEALGAFNNLFFETEVNTNLTTGNVVLLPHAGPVAPTDGRAFTLIEGSNNVAGFVTLIHLPLDAQTLSLDTRFLAGTTNGLLTNALLAVAVWDTNGMGAGMDILPAIDEMQGFAPPYGGYAFASEWRTASLSVTGMQGPVYLAVFLDTESATNEVLAVALDALRVSDLPQERPFLAHRWDETAPALELSWPTNANRFVLRSAETLDAGYWMRVLEPATRTGTNWVISLPPSATNRFFRLQFD